MNEETRTLLNSGDLELYVLGQLTPEQQQYIAELAATHPEIRAEIDSIESSLLNYARAHAIKPSDAVRQRVLLAIDDSPSESTPLIVVSGHKNGENGGSRVITLNNDHSADRAGRPMFYLFSLAASLLLLAVSVLFAVNYHSKWKQAEGQLVALQTTQTAIASRLASMQNDSTTLAFISNPNTVTTQLSGTKAAPKSGLRVAWNKEQGRGIVLANTLPVAPEGKQYQLWALHNGQPVDAGMLQINSGRDGYQSTKPVAAAEAFAVTLEPLGGSRVPTLEALFASGNVAKTATL